MTFEELKEELSRLDEVTLIEVLGLNSEELVEQLEDVILEKQDELRRQVQDEEEDD